MAMVYLSEIKWHWLVIIISQIRTCGKSGPTNSADDGVEGWKMGKYVWSIKVPLTNQKFLPLRTGMSWWRDVLPQIHLTTVPLFPNCCNSDFLWTHLSGPYPLIQIFNSWQLLISLISLLSHTSWYLGTPGTSLWYLWYLCGVSGIWYLTPHSLTQISVVVMSHRSSLGGNRMMAGPGTSYGRASLSSKGFRFVWTSCHALLLW